MIKSNLECVSYYACIDGVLKTFQCEAGTLWANDLTACALTSIVKVPSCLTTSPTTSIVITGTLIKFCKKKSFEFFENLHGNISSFKETILTQYDRYA